MSWRAEEHGRGEGLIADRPPTALAGEQRRLGRSWTLRRAPLRTYVSVFVPFRPLEHGVARPALDFRNFGLYVLFRFRVVLRVFRETLFRRSYSSYSQRKRPQTDVSFPENFVGPPCRVASRRGFHGAPKPTAQLVLSDRRRQRWARRRRPTTEWRRQRRRSASRTRSSSPRTTTTPELAEIPLSL